VVSRLEDLDLAAKRLIVRLRLDEIFLGLKCSRFHTKLLAIRTETGKLPLQHAFSNFGSA
jgi:hypothetical protein